MTPIATEPEPAESIRILIVDEVRLYREGLVSLLRQQRYVREVRSVARADQALAVAQDLQVEVVLLNMSYPEQTATLRDLVTNFPQAKIIAFGLSDKSEILIACAEAGAAGYISRDGSLEELGTIILGVLRNQALFSPQIVTTLLRGASGLGRNKAPRRLETHTRLTRRESEIVTCINDGLSNKEIAQRLHIDVHTVKNHVHNILEKLQVRRRGEAAAMVRSFASSILWGSVCEVRARGPR